MLDICALTEDDVGAKVVYRSCFGKKAEDGIIRSWNDKFVFVSYASSGFPGIATSPDDLTFLNGSYDELVAGSAELWNVDNPPEIT